MSPKITGLAGARSGGCQKAGCKVFAPLDRHHTGSQKLFVHNFRWREGTARYEKFAANYYKFRPQDIVMVCRAHHTDLHVEYHVIIRKHCRRNKALVQSFTWAQAYCLMKELQSFCRRWLKKSPRRL